MLITEITQLKLEGVAGMKTDKAFCGVRLTAPEERRWHRARNTGLHLSCT